MKKKSSSGTSQSNLPVSKQTAGAVAGAVVGSVVAGPVGAVVGGITGTIMGNRAAKGKTLVSSSTVQKAKSAMKTVGEKLPSLKRSRLAITTKKRSSRPKALKARVTIGKASAARKRKPARSRSRKSR